MDCFDCTTQGRPTRAVAVCSLCGAAVCTGCAHVGTRTLRHAAGFAPAEVATTSTRVIACALCSTVLNVRHAGLYNFTSPSSVSPRETPAPAGP